MYYSERQKEELAECWVSNMNCLQEISQVSICSVGEAGLPVTRIASEALQV